MLVALPSLVRSYQKDSARHNGDHDAYDHDARHICSPAFETTRIPRHVDSNAPFYPSFAMLVIRKQPLPDKLLCSWTCWTRLETLQFEVRDSLLSWIDVWVLLVTPMTSEVEEGGIICAHLCVCGKEQTSQLQSIRIEMIEEGRLNGIPARSSVAVVHQDFVMDMITVFELARLRLEHW